MAIVKLQAGAEIDFLTKEEMDGSLADAIRNLETARARAVKWMRVPELLSGKVSGSAISLGPANGQMVGPRAGYFWTFRRLVVIGLATGATPDVVNLYHDSATGVPLWQFNGNNFGYTWGSLTVSLNNGEYLALANSGNLAATGQITLGGELIEVPAELAGKLA